MLEKKYHFVGLGGVGMSALARILLQKGCQVEGSDQSTSPLLEQLQKEGAIVKVGHEAKHLQDGVTVVYSSSIQKSNPEIAQAQELNLPILHRSDLLDLLMQGQKPLLITGTHGKTTTSALLASVLYDAQMDPSFALGGILLSLDTNGRFGKGRFFVAEADESDGSFLKTHGFGAIVTNLGKDHLDYWGNEEHLNAGFRQFFSQVQSPEHLFWCFDDLKLSSLQCTEEKSACGTALKGISYGFSKGAMLHIEAFEQTESGICFDLTFRDKKYRNIELALLGRHNALNGAAVFGLSLQLEIPEERIRRAFAKFSNTKRRMEKKGQARTVQIFDDYAHHPTEIAATLKGLRGHVKEKRLVAIFQPHRYTRVRDLFHQFLHCFSEADLVVLTDIYAAGETSIEGITTAALYTKMKEVLGPKLHFLPRPHLEAGVAALLKLHDVVITLGAGDVTCAGEPILQKWAAKMVKMRVGMLCGGTSAEHEVSLLSAQNISQGLDASIYEVDYFMVTKQGDWLVDSHAMEDLFSKQIPCEQGSAKVSLAVLEKLSRCDVCIPVFHGPQGEDGMIQGFLEALQVPYAGCDYRLSAICMHKGWTKQIALMQNIPTAPFFTLEIHEYKAHPEKLLDWISARMQYPVWIKPVHLGSSIGVRRANNPEQAKEMAEFAFSYDDSIIVDQHVEGKQIEFGILGNEYLKVGPSCEILNEGAFVDYKDKYGPTAMPYAIPARITKLQEEIGTDLAKRAYIAAGCRGLARIDFFLDHNGYYWLNEINPFPGCTPTSAFPKIWEKKGVSMNQICDDLVVYALHASRKLQRIRSK